MSNDGVRYELIEGRLKKTESDWSRTRSDSCPLSLVRRLANHVEDNNLGVALAAETGFRLAQDPDTVRAPGEEVEEKVNDWLDHGCSMVWVVSPKQKTISVSCSKTDITILCENETLDGRNVVPGFQCSVQEIFTIP